MPETSANDTMPAEGAELEGVPPGGPQPACMIAVSELTAHPGNVREDLDLTAQFLASIAGPPPAGRRGQGRAGSGAVRAGSRPGR